MFGSKPTRLSTHKGQSEATKQRTKDNVKTEERKSEQKTGKKETEIECQHRNRSPPNGLRFNFGGPKRGYSLPEWIGSKKRTVLFATKMVQPFCTREVSKSLTPPRLTGK